MRIKTVLSTCSQRPSLIAILVSGLFIYGCASSSPAPTSTLNAAQTAVISAERFDAGRFASSELGEARQLLARANAAVEAENMEEARRLALEAQVTAELAYAKAEAAKAAEINAELQRSADALREELNRTGEQQ